MMRQFLDLDQDNLRRIEVSVDQTGKGERVLRVGPKEVYFSHPFLEDEEHASTNFISCFCWSSRTAARDVRIVYLQPDDKRIGYIFPLATFGLVEKLDSKWANIFAKAGFEEVITPTNIDLFSIVRSVDALPKQEAMSVLDLFGDELSVLVLSKAALKEAKIGIPSLELMFLRSGVWPLRDRLLPVDQIRFDSDNSRRVSLRRIAPEYLSEMRTFVELFQDADRSSSAAGAFLSYYQIIEFLLEKVFSHAMPRITQRAQTTWDMKEALAQLTSEKHRLHLLCQDYLLSSCDRSKLDDTGERAVDLLKQLGEVGEFPTEWHLRLYRVRSILVHNQLKLFRSRDRSTLWSLNKSLRLAVLELMTHTSF